MSAPHVAFYAPLKAPDHPTPSGDRTVARLYIAALEAAGFNVEIVSDLRSLDGKGDSVSQARIREAAAAEITRITARWQARPQTRPALWFTYHLYYKAPDLIGPHLARAFDCPYVVAEASHAPSRASGRWSAFYAEAESAIATADLAIVTTRRDWPCVAALRTGRQTVQLPPFVAPLPGIVAPQSSGPFRLITLAMMREGDKLASYLLLAEALKSLTGDWTLTIIGDGPARAGVEAAFAPFGPRVKFKGLIEERAALGAELAKADLFVWPAVNEAYGMALLEAQSIGLPVVAGREGGVADALLEGETGVLVPPRDAAAFAGAIRAVMGDAPRRAAMAVAARHFATGERSVASAARTLRTILKPWIGSAECES